MVIISNFLFEYVVSHVKIGDFVGHLRYFGRPTPHAKARAAEGAVPKTLLTVSKDRIAGTL